VLYGLVCLLATHWALAAGGEYAGRASVIDGDTIDVLRTRIRLWGIDAPESAQLCRRDGKPWRCGRDAALALADWLGTRTVRCEERSRDRYGRVIAVCRVGGADVSAWLVEQGWALAFRKYSLDYVANEDWARSARHGIWSSSFEAPWDWRQGQKQH
jgi:endonuclease YncB( thermonuclease family)